MHAQQPQPQNTSSMLHDAEANLPGSRQDKMENNLSTSIDRKARLLKRVAAAPIAQEDDVLVVVSSGDEINPPILTSNTWRWGVEEGALI